MHTKTFLETSKNLHEAEESIIYLQIRIKILVKFGLVSTEFKASLSLLQFLYSFSKRIKNNRRYFYQWYLCTLLLSVTDGK